MGIVANNGTLTSEASLKVRNCGRSLPSDYVAPFFMLSLKSRNVMMLSCYFHMAVVNSEARSFLRFHSRSQQLCKFV